jgi:tetratricopeptide (TPR) repeat protein
MRLQYLLTAIVLVACAGAPVRPASNSPHLADEKKSALETVQMSPFYFEGGAAGLDIYTDSDLFRRAGDAYDASDWKAAFNIYRKIIDKFPASDYSILSYYNAGLCLEKLGEYEKAAQYYLATSELISPEAALALDVAVHLGGVYEQTSRWSLAAETFAELLARRDLPEEDRWRFEARRFIALAFLEGDDDALDELDSFAKRYTKYLEKRKEFDNTWLARARFTLGEVYYQQFTAVTLTLPQEKLRDDLERKAELLLRAQSHYMKTLQIKNLEWATAAVYRIGSAYEEFYHALNNAPVPPELDEEEKEVYLEELRLATEPVRTKAIMAYDRIIRFSNQLAIRTDWVDLARQRVVELRTIGRFVQPDAAVR